MNNLFGAIGAGVLTAFILGFSAGYWLCLNSYGAQAEREKALLEYQKKLNEERATLQDMRSLSVDEVKKWAAAQSESSAKFTEIIHKLHQWEKQLQEPNHHLVFGCAFFVLIALGLVVVAWRASAIRTEAAMENAIIIMPALRKTLKPSEEMRFIDERNVL